MIRLIIYILCPENIVIIHDQSLSSPCCHACVIHSLRPPAILDAAPPEPTRSIEETACLHVRVGGLFWAHLLARVLTRIAIVYMLTCIAIVLVCLYALRQTQVIPHSNAQGCEIHISGVGTVMVSINMFADGMDQHVFSVITLTTAQPTIL